MMTIYIVSCTRSPILSNEILAVVHNIGLPAKHINHEQLNSDTIIGKHGDVLMFVLDKLEQADAFQSLVNNTAQDIPTIKLCLFTQAPEIFSETFYMKFHDFLCWPCSSSEIISRIRSHHRTDDQRGSSTLEPQVMEKFADMNLVGRSPAFIKVAELTHKVSACFAPVLIQGETGTGKENVARSIHYLGERRDNAFIPLNCGSIPDELFDSELFGHEKGSFTDAKASQPGLVALADGGTLFLDEIDSLSLKAQTSLLRFLQTQEYRPLGSKVIRYADVRIIAATNSCMRTKIKQNRFREDLFYRINVLNITIPALRFRIDDIPLIANQLLHKFSQQYNAPVKQLTHRSIYWLCQQTWPGNVRELENTLLREVFLSEGLIIDISQVMEADNQVLISNGTKKSPPPFQAAKAAAIESFERNYLQDIIEIAEGNVSEAARIAGKERRCFGKLLKKYDIH